MLAEKAEEIKTTVINEIQNWLIVSIVKQATIKILSMLNPAGAIVQAILMIYDFAMWLINNWERIVQIIQNIVSSVGKIAMGMLGEAAKFIENTLANFVPLLLDFMARMLRLGNVSARIKKILMRLKKPVDELMEKIMAFIRKKLRKFSKKKPKKGKEEREDKQSKEYTRFANEIKKKLENKKDVDATTYESLRTAKEKEAKQLEKIYHGKVKTKEKVNINFIETSKDKKDNDIDIKIKVDAIHIKAKLKLDNDDEILLNAKEQYINLANEKHTLKFDKKGEKYILMRYSYPPMLVKEWLTEQENSINASTSLSQKDKDDKLRTIKKAREVADKLEAFSYPDLKTNPKPKKNPQAEVDKLLDKLMLYVKKVDQHILPLPNMVTVPPFTNNKASKIEVSYLARGNHRPGTAANSTKNIPEADSILRSMGLRAAWVAFHLFNENLGGLAVESNLVPTPQFMNKDYLNEFERDVKDFHDDDNKKLPGQQANSGRNVIYFYSQVSYHKGVYKDAFVKSIKSVAYLMKPGKNKWVQNKTAKIGEWDRKGIELPKPEKIKVNLLPSSKIDRETMFSSFNIDNSLIEIIYELSRSTTITHFKQIVGFAKSRATSQGKLKRYITQINQGEQNGKFDYSVED
ncbi:hypothetical protein [uncultured Microscilla sp.]|uniref:hypothetical protein n=1 Tax=uncultured Microscilla sp. TaxID=432653 RepID=UPI00261F09F7|nr:hypothetical protein [uncultured Microscilla sp.]